MFRSLDEVAGSLAINALIGTLRLLGGGADAREKIYTRRPGQQRTHMNVPEGCEFPAYRPSSGSLRRVGRVGAVRAAVARAHDPVVARRRRSGRPGAVLKSGCGRSPA